MATLLLLLPTAVWLPVCFLGSTPARGQRLDCGMLPSNGTLAERPWWLEPARVLRDVPAGTEQERQHARRGGDAPGREGNRVRGLAGEDGGAGHGTTSRHAAAAKTSKELN